MALRYVSSLATTALQQGIIVRAAISQQFALRPPADEDEADNTSIYFDRRQQF